MPLTEILLLGGRGGQRDCRTGQPGPWRTGWRVRWSELANEQEENKEPAAAQEREFDDDGNAQERGDNETGDDQQEIDQLRQKLREAKEEIAELRPLPEKLRQAQDELVKLRQENADLRRRLEKSEGHEENSLQLTAGGRPVLLCLSLRPP